MPKERGFLNWMQQAGGAARSNNKQVFPCDGTHDPNQHAMATHRERAGEERSRQENLRNRAARNYGMVLVKHTYVFYYRDDDPDTLKCALSWAVFKP